MTTTPSATFDGGHPVPGDVVVVPFPYADRLAEKRRPALVVSGASLAEAGLVWVLMITSARAGTLPHDLRIDDHAAVGLPVPCVVRPTKIACIEPSRILRRMGGLAPSALQRVLTQVRSFLPSAPRRA